MIIKIHKNAKARVVFKEKEQGVKVAYARTKIGDKMRRLLIRDAKQSIETFGITPKNCHVYGDLLFYEPINGLRSTVKFKIKGIDKFPNVKPNIEIKILKHNETRNAP